jgi:hypothetical protein
MNRVQKTALLATAFALMMMPGPRPAAVAADHVSPPLPSLFPSGQGGIPLPGGTVKKMPPGFYREERFIRQLYRGFLGREPGSDEVRSWRQRLDAGGTPADLVRDFLAADEFYIRQCYLGLLGRQPDPNGMSAYTQFLRSGHSRGEMLDSILSSQEFQQRMR